MKSRAKFFWLLLVVWIFLLIPAIQAAPDTGFTKKVLKNGLTVLYKVMPGQPLVSVYALFPIGMNSEQEKGIAHLLEHLVFRGGSGYNFSDIAAVTTRQGGQFNGFTSAYATTYNYVVAKENFESALKIFNGSIWKTGLEEPVVVLERKIVLHEQDMDYADRYQYYPIFRYLYPETQYSKATVESITIADLKNFHQCYYQPGTATYIIAGDFKPEAVLPELEKLQNGYGQSTPPAVTIRDFSLPQGNIIEERNIYPYKFELMMSYEFSGLTPKERILLKLLSYIYGYEAKIDYSRNEYKVYNTISRSVGSKDYFAIYYVERNRPFNETILNEEKGNMLKFFREYRKLDFKKELKNFLQEIELEIATSQQSATDAVEYEVQRLVNPENITVDSLPVLKKLSQKDLEAFITTYFEKPPTSWILVKTTK